MEHTEREFDRRRVAALLRRYGWNATSFQALEPDFEYWFADSSGEACVAYVEAGRAWVVAGPPIASEERIGEIAARFVEHARVNRRRVCFFAVEQRFLRAIGMHSMQIGEQPWFDPQQWSERQRGHRSLKEQLRRARAKGVVVERVQSAAAADPDSTLRRDIEHLIDRWLCSRPMPPMAFLVELHPFGFAEERRSYVARQQRRIVGVLRDIGRCRADGGRGAGVQRATCTWNS